MTVWSKSDHTLITCDKRHCYSLATNDYPTVRGGLFKLLSALGTHVASQSSLHTLQAPSPPLSLRKCQWRRSVRMEKGFFSNRCMAIGNRRIISTQTTSEAAIATISTTQSLSDDARREHGDLQIPAWGTSRHGIELREDRHTSELQGPQSSKRSISSWGSSLPL